MVPEAQRLHASFVAALPAYLTERYSSHGYPLDRRSIESIDRATDVLASELGHELALPFHEQRRSPLEIVRQVLTVPNDALAERGTPPLATTASMFADDPYGLAPGSSSDLGATAHEAHLLWGAAKAAAFTGAVPTVPSPPVVAVMAGSRSDREELVALIEAAGLQCVAVRNPGAVADAIDSGSVVFALVDLDHRSARDALVQLTASRIATITYGDSIDDLIETGLRAQGVRDVVSRQRLMANPVAFIPVIA
ncbi:MAG: hypothetical protein WCC01_13135 [Acidimicrobiia bacterium]